MKRSFIDNQIEVQNFINNSDESPDVIIPKRFLENIIDDWDKERTLLIKKLEES